MYQQKDRNITPKGHIIDFRSDTMTRPSTAMRRAMSEAVVGDDVFNEDPTVTRLEQRTAELMGKEAGLFVTSGTQSNLIALLTHCGRGEEVIVGREYHINDFEAGGASALGGIVVHTLSTDKRGMLTPEQVKGAIKSDHIWYPMTKLLCLENTVSGNIQPLDQIQSLCDVARENGLSLHLDGARIWNASVALDVPLATIAAPFDSVSCCLSKGLGAPVGSVLTGSTAFIARARRTRKMLGGGMRQAGVLAACGLYALDHNITRLAEDHKKVKMLNQALQALPNLSVIASDTNMFFLKPLAEDRSPLIAHLEKEGIFAGPPAEEIRMVTHLDISMEDIKKTITVIRGFYNG